MAKQTAPKTPAPKVEKEEWQDISHEAYRTYVVPTVGGHIMDVKIDNPTDLQRLPDGTHIIKDSKGFVHEISPEWVKLTYKVK